MTFDAKNMKNQIRIIAYEQPSLKKYGTMKNLTFAASGSGGDGMGTNDTNADRGNAQKSDQFGFGDTKNNDQANSSGRGKLTDDSIEVGIIDDKLSSPEDI